MRIALQKWIKSNLCFIALGAITLPACAQKKRNFNNPDIRYIEERGFSLGATIGFTDLWGDVGTKSPIDHYINSNFYNDPLKNMRGMVHFFGRYTYVPGISFRAGIGYGQLYATDAWNEDKALKTQNYNDDAVQRYVRNLDVHVNIWEASLLFEFAPLQLIDWSTGRIAPRRVQPYLIAGISGFHFNPRGTYKDLVTGTETLVELQPLRTEGQGFKSPDIDFPDHYSLWSGAGVAGLGLRFDIKSNFTIGLEYQLRMTMTDYLDDVSGEYIDPFYFDIAHQGNPKQAYLSRRMADKSREVIPGMENVPGSLRGSEGNDMFSSVSITLYWKLKGRKNPWW